MVKRTDKKKSINDPVEVVDAKYDASGTISCMIKLSADQANYWGVTTSPYDSAAHSVKLFNELEAGDWGEVEAYTDEDKKHDKALQNSLVQSDLIAIADSNIRLLSEERDAGIISDDDLDRWKTWIIYRKALRELDVSKDDVAWPAKPE